MNPWDEPKMPSREALEETYKLMQHAEVLPVDPTEDQIKHRVEELMFLGLADQPEWIGISSSVRQYAIATLGRELSLAAGKMIDDEDGIAFVTNHAGLIAMADLLQEHYTIRPIGLAEFAKMIEAKLS